MQTPYGQSQIKVLSFRWEILGETLKEFNWTRWKFLETLLAKVDGKT